MTKVNNGLHKCKKQSKGYSKGQEKEKRNHK